MTNREAYQTIRRELEKAGNEAPAFDASCLLQKFLGLDRQGLLLFGDKPADPVKAGELFLAAKERVAGRPLQYLLGEWPFLDLTLKVGEGVLIPREETELLVRTAAERLPRGGRVLDLCAGTGAVGLGLASLRPDLTVACGEKYDAAFSYLEQNVRAYPKLRVQARKMDLFSKADAEKAAPLSGLLCNPPYIRTKDLAGLQKEVQQEPATALDGGEDGLLFYRSLCFLWVPALSPGGLLAVEIGEDQGAACSALLREAGLLGVEVLRDFADHDRVALGVCPAEK